MDNAVRVTVRQRANNVCEYCQIHQKYYPDFTFHIEHIVARQHGGGDDLSNLALACHFCNSKKGPNLSGIDPHTGELTRLFNPRSDKWKQHFRFDSNATVIGLTAVGRTTAFVLDMNTAARIQIRRMIKRLGE